MPVIDLALESCDYDYDPAQEELYSMAVKVIICLLCVNSGPKYYIPGETMESDKLRLKGIESGLLHLLAWLKTKSQSQEVRDYILVFDCLDESDWA